MHGLLCAGWSARLRHVAGVLGRELRCGPVGPGSGRAVRRPRSGRHLQCALARGTSVSVTRRSPKPQRQVRFLGPPLRGTPISRAIRPARRRCPWGLGRPLTIRMNPHESAGFLAVRSLAAHSDPGRTRVRMWPRGAAGAWPRGPRAGYRQRRAAGPEGTTDACPVWPCRLRRFQARRSGVGRTRSNERAR